jgi:hypothetical protein
MGGVPLDQPVALDGRAQGRQVCSRVVGGIIGVFFGRVFFVWRFVN